MTVSWGPADVALGSVRGPAYVRDVASEGTRFERVAKLLLGRDQVADDVEGDVRSAAVLWLAEAEADLDAIGPAIAAGRYRVAYNAAYDTFRHAAEAVIHASGYRVLSGRGAHEATFALAAAILEDEPTDVFEAANASVIRNTRNGLEYLDPTRPVAVTEADARWAEDLARRAVAACSTYVERTSG